MDTHCIALDIAYDAAMLTPGPSHVCVCVSIAYASIGHCVGHATCQRRAASRASASSPCSLPAPYLMSLSDNSSGQSRFECSCPSHPQSETLGYVACDNHDRGRGCATSRSTSLPLLSRSLPQLSFGRARAVHLLFPSFSRLLVLSLAPLPARLPSVPPASKMYHEVSLLSL
eukprot:507559-Rhodomonas_salina.2